MPISIAPQLSIEVHGDISKLGPHPADEKVLYHYTTAKGLLGLLGNPQTPAALWLTQVHYMNDSEEFYHAHEMVCREVISQASACPGVRRAMNGTYGMPYDHDETQLRPIRESLLSRDFAFSLSEKPDLLSQWRGYAPEGGYCIGFRVRELRRLASAHGLMMVKCIYNDQQKRREISETIRAVEYSLNQGEIESPYSENEELTVAERVNATARARMQFATSIYTLGYKHHSFEEEHEWRIVGRIGPSGDKRARWRDRGNQIVPYCELDISSNGKYPLSVEEVIVGPGVDFFYAQHAIEYMNFTLAPKIKITPSASTLRR